MKQSIRGVRGRQSLKDIDSSETGMKDFPWKNPFKGEYKKVASAALSVKGAGLMVGFKVKF